MAKRTHPHFSTWRSARRSCRPRTTISSVEGAGRFREVLRGALPPATTVRASIFSAPHIAAAFFAICIGLWAGLEFEHSPARANWRAPRWPCPALASARLPSSRLRNSAWFSQPQRAAPGRLPSRAAQPGRNPPRGGPLVPPYHGRRLHSAPPALISPIDRRCGRRKMDFPVRLRGPIASER